MNTTKPKILVAANHLKIGGIERQIVYLVNGLSNKGFDIILYLYENTGDLLDHINSKVKTISYDRKPFKNSKFLNSLYELNKTINIYKPDILYCSFWPLKRPTSLIGLLKKIKVVLVEQNNTVEQINKKKFRNLHYIFRKYTHKYSTENIAVSNDLGELINSYYNLENNYKIIHNSIDIDFITNKSLEKVNHQWFGNDIPIVIAIGRLVGQKGFEYLIKAVDIILKNRQIRLLIVGDGENKAKLIKYANELSISENIDFVGLKENPYPYIANSDIFVIPSIHEGFPNTLLEAMCLGLPIVSTDFKFGSNEIIDHELNGILVPLKSSEKIAEGIISILDNQNFSKSLGTEARKKADYFSIDNMISQYEKLFMDMFYE